MLTYILCYFMTSICIVSQPSSLGGLLDVGAVDNNNNTIHARGLVVYLFRSKNNYEDNC
jgi:hypothetical protein